MNNPSNEGVLESTKTNLTLDVFCLDSHFNRGQGDQIGQFIANGTIHFKNVNNYLNTNIYSNLETSGGPVPIYIFSSFFQHQC